MSVPRSSAHRTWPLVAAGTALVGASYGLARYAYGLYLPEVRAEVGFSASAAGLVAAAGYAAYCVGLVAGAVVAEQRHARGVALAAGLCAAAGTGATAVAEATAVVATGVALGGMSTGLASPALAGLIAARIAPAARERALSVVNAGTGVGLLVCAPAAMAAPGTWRAAFAGFGALSLAVTLAVAAATGPAPGAAEQRSGAEDEAGGGRRSGARERVPLALGALGVGAAGSAYLTFGRDLLAAAGSAGTGPLLWTALGGAAVLAAVTGDLVARGRADRLWAALLLALAASTAGLALAPGSLPLAIAGAMVFGASFVAVTGMIVLWATRLEPGRPAAAMSAPFVLLAVGGMAGAAVAGALADRAGWVAAFLAAAGVAVATAPLGYTPAARRALACAASSSASPGSGSSGASRRRAVAITQSANQAFLGSSGPCR
jgi:predicted MFS family arabinose efflux permease